MARRHPEPPPDPHALTEDQILAWADAHKARTGRWPAAGSGPVLGVPRQKWSALDIALRVGCRGLPGGSSLARLLAARRGHRNPRGLLPLTEDIILALADVHYWATGAWPTRTSGPVQNCAVPGETWARLNNALVLGQRGLTGGTSLAQLLAARRGVRNPKGLPPLTEEQILAWADAHFARHGKWPRENLVPVEDAPGEVWRNIAQLLRSGGRGLPGGTSLRQLLVRHGRRQDPPSRN
jgi:hypothetical protein